MPDKFTQVWNVYGGWIIFTLTLIIGFLAGIAVGLSHLR